MTRTTPLAAAVLLGLGTYSKPLPTAILVAPLVLLARVPARGWLDLGVAAAWTLSRVLLSTAPAL